MAYLNMGLGVTEAEDEYNKQLSTYKSRGCETETSSSCDQDWRLVLLYAERNELHNAGVRGISIEQVKAQLAAGKTMIAGFPQGVIVNLLGAAKAKAMIATGKHKPSEAAKPTNAVKQTSSGPRTMTVSDVKTATLADRIEQLEAARIARENQDQERSIAEMDTRLREIARGKGRARAQVIVTPLALLAAAAIVSVAVYGIVK